MEWGGEATAVPISVSVASGRPPPVFTHGSSRRGGGGPLSFPPPVEVVVALVAALTTESNPCNCQYCRTTTNMRSFLFLFSFSLVATVLLWSVFENESRDRSLCPYSISISINNIVIFGLFA